MDWLVIEGVRPWDGRYEFDLENRPLTRREWGWIKRFAGYLPLTVDEGWRGADPELFATFAVIALHRAGRVQDYDAQDVYDRFGDTAFDAQTIRFELDEGDAGPPDRKQNANGSFSGDGSTTSSETSRPIPPPTGIPASATSASVPAGSAS